MAGERTRKPRPISELEPGKIAKLRAESRTPPPEEADEVSFADLDDEPRPPVVLISRNETLHDPLTTSLLAEVARRSQTMELDSEDADDVRTAIQTVIVEDQDVEHQHVEP